MGGDGELSLHRFRFNLDTGGVKEETLDDRMLEFPRCPGGRLGQKNRYGYLLNVASKEDGTPAFEGLVKLDLKTGTSQTHKYGEHSSSAEPIFVPAAGSDPDGDEGWVMSYVHDESENVTDFTVLDASNLSTVAKVRLPQRVPYGFHGSWLSDEV
jgi:carotenoid cleavage dioxygenase-like enzyme